jgi:hypothetical protein
MVRSHAFLIVLFVAGVARAEPRPLRIVETTPLSCPSSAEIETALARRGMRPQKRAGYQLRLAQEGPGRLRVELLGPQGLVNQRRLSTESSHCATLADTAALVVDAWLRELPWHSALPHKKPEPSVTPTENPTPAPDPVAPEPTPDDPAGKLPVDDPTPAPDDDPSDEPKPVAEKPPLPKTPSPIHLEARIAAGGALGLSSDLPLVAAGAIAFELSVSPRWSLALRAGLDSPIDALHPPGSVEWRRVPFAAYTRLVLHSWGPVRATLHGGLLVDVILADSQNFSTNGSATVVDPGLLAGAGLDWSINRFLSLFAEIRGEISLRNHTFDIENLGVVATMPRAWLGFEAGVALRFF